MPWAPDYAEPPELKSYLRIDDTADDAFIALWITTVSGNVNDFTRRQFGQVDALEARTYTPVYDRHLCAHVLVVDDVQDVTGLTIVDEEGTAVTGHTYEPVNAVKKGRPYERLILGSAASSFTGDLTVSALWGWTAASVGPTVAKTGLFLQAARLAARRDSPFGIAGSPSEGSEIRLLAQLDPDFKTSLKPLRREWWAA
jgi:hypothetical protein